MTSRRILAVLALCAALPLGAQARERATYDHHFAGDRSATRPGPTQGGLMLLGGGNPPAPAFRWFVESMGHGHLVILRTSGADELQQDFLREIGGVASIQTLVFHDRAAASELHVLDVLRGADGILFGDGDPADYLRYFRGTPLNAVIEDHVRGGKPLGGAGGALAILGGFGHESAKGGDLLSAEAMRKPMGSDVKLARDFLHLPFLSQVIIDSDLARRGRWGRLAVLVGRLAAEEREPGITGIGIDENAALCIEPNGMGRVYANGRGFVWLVRPLRAPDVLGAGPFNFRGVPFVGVGEEGGIDFNTFAVTRPAFQVRANIVNGAFEADSLAALAAAARTPSPAAAGPRERRWSLAIHGGAGVIERGDLTAAKEAAYRAALDAALAAGARVLEEGGASVDAVEAAIRVLEDDPLFNAGKGAVFTADGRNELDASIMEGATRRAGAVAGVTRTRNPISLARAVMEKSPHVLLAREGADQFALEQGLPQVDREYFRTEERWKQLLQWRRAQQESDRTHSRGTVGAVALDVHGHVAAGTSTGGMTGKRWGRVGDSPVIGAGTYAADGVCAVSATGSGEYFIRAAAARQLCDRIALRGDTVQAAATATIVDVGNMGGDGGLIALDGAGRIAFAMNTSGMYRGWASDALPPRTAIYSSEPVP